MPKRSTGVLIAASIVSLLACQSMPYNPASHVKYMPVDGARLPYIEQGRGTPVVFVHGAVSDHRTWERQREALSSQPPGRYRAIAYTQRYFGTEPWNKDGPKFGVQTHSDDLAAFIRGLGAGPVHVVACSYSGHVALNVAFKHPELIRSAFVFEPAVPSYVTDPADLKALGDDAGAMFGPVVQAVQAGDNAAAVRRLIDAVGERPGYFDALPGAGRAIMLDSAPTMPALMADQAPPLTCADLGRIEPPVAVVRGELVRPFFRVVADAAARCVRGTRLIVAPKAKHMWPGEDVEGFTRTLTAFLQDK